MSDHPFFQSIYDRADGNAKDVPWADLSPKSHLVDWLQNNLGHGRSALDIACGLGDNAEALANHKWDTSAFDFSTTAIDWAKRRFPTSQVDYQEADLFNLPEEWSGKFDLVWECFTIQSFEPADHALAAEKIASLVADNGRLLVYCMTRPEGQSTNGPPFPLRPNEVDVLATMGFSLQSQEHFDFERRGRQFPHSFSVWSKTANIL